MRVTRFSKSEMMAIEPPVPARPIDEDDENQHREKPVAYRPIEQQLELPNKPSSECPDQFHLRTPWEIALCTGEEAI